MGGIHDVWLLPCMTEFLASILIILSGIPLMNIKNKLSFLLQVPENLKHWICEICFRRSRHLVYLTPACGKTVVKGRNQTILLGLRLTTTSQPDLINVPASPNPYFQHPAHQCMCRSSFIGLFQYPMLGHPRQNCCCKIWSLPMQLKQGVKSLGVVTDSHGSFACAGKNPDPLLWKC